MTYEEPPRCATCKHRGEVHRDWFTGRPKECSQFGPGGSPKCQCKRYAKAA